MFRRPLACTGLVLLACAALSPAQDSVTIDGFQLGTPVLGPKLDPADLKGKVVLLEFWGIN